jgi:hypothetical protein
VQLGWISRQLGHADVEVTARHYARWCGGDVYRDAMTALPGEVAADYMTRVVAESPHESAYRHDGVSTEETAHTEVASAKSRGAEDFDTRRPLHLLCEQASVHT